MFNAAAEVLIENSPASLPARVTELSLRGCFLNVSGSFTEHQCLQIKIFESEEFFEARAKVLYVRPSGVGLLFTEMNPHFRAVLQKWILAALDDRIEATTEVEI